MSGTNSQNHCAEIAIQSQLARIKREEEEEEELWISGEELYTEGSSDEEEIEKESRSRSRVNKTQSSRSSSANPSVARRGRSPVRTETRAKSENAVHVTRRALDETEFVPKNTSNFHKTFSSHVESYDLTNESSSLKRSLKEELSRSKIWKDGSNQSNEMIFDNCMDEISDASSSFVITEGWIEKEILKIMDLDSAIREVDSRIKVEVEETLSYQCANRQRLENILSSGPPETGKLAENTRQFFQLCPKYATLVKVTDIRDESRIGTSRELTDDLRDEVENEFSEPSINHTQQIDDYDPEMFCVTKKYKDRVTDLMRDFENGSDESANFDSNPYVLDEGRKETLLDAEVEICGHY